MSGVKIPRSDDPWVVEEHERQDSLEANSAKSSLTGKTEKVLTFIDLWAKIFIAALKLALSLLLLLIMVNLFFYLSYEDEGVYIQPFATFGSENNVSGTYIAQLLYNDLNKINSILQQADATNHPLGITSGHPINRDTLQGIGKLSIGLQPYYFISKESYLDDVVLTNIGPLGLRNTPLGTLMASIKSLVNKKQPSIIKGNLQKDNSTLILVASSKGEVLGTIGKTITRDSSVDELIPPMADDLAFVIAHYYLSSNVLSRKDLSPDWLAFKYFVQAENAYLRYNTSKDISDLKIATDLSLQAISEDHNYKLPFILLSNIALSFYKEGNYGEAIQTLDMAIELNPQYADAWSNRGLALDAQGKYDEAIQAYNKAIELDSKFALPWNGKGIALDAQGKYDEAIQAYNKAIEIDPQYVDAWCNKGAALGYLGKYDEAIQACNKAVDLNPSDANAWNGKGIALDAQGKYDEAIQAYNKAIELDSKFALPWNGKGIALDAQGKYDEAIQAYNKAIEIDPQYVDAWRNKGGTLGYLGRFDEANQVYNEAIQEYDRSL